MEGRIVSKIIQEKFAKCKIVYLHFRRLAPMYIFLPNSEHAPLRTLDIEG